MNSGSVSAAASTHGTAQKYLKKNQLCICRYVFYNNLRGEFCYLNNLLFI